MIEAPMWFLDDSIMRIYSWGPTGPYFTRKEVNMKSYKGYTYKADYDYEDNEPTTIYHYAIDPSGYEYRLDFSGHCEMNETAFNALVDMNFPSRPTKVAPWDTKSIECANYTSDYTIVNKRLTFL